MNRLKLLCDLAVIFHQARDWLKWDEDKHPRDRDGRFKENGEGSSGGNNEVFPIESIIELSGEEISRQFDVDGMLLTQVLLPKQEYATVMHAVDTNITPERIAGRMFHQNIGNNMYAILIVDEDDKDYVVIGKEPII